MSSFMRNRNTSRHVIIYIVLGNEIFTSVTTHDERYAVEHNPTVRSYILNALLTFFFLSFFFFVNYKKSKTPLKLYLLQILSNVFFFYKYFVNLTTKNLLGYIRGKNVENKEPEIALILYTPSSNPLRSAEF